MRSTVCFWCRRIKHESLSKGTVLLPATRPSRRLRRLAERSGGKCHYCDAPFSFVAHVNGNSGSRSPSLEHIIPLSRGGTKDPENEVVACRRCNHNKGDLLLVEWIEKLREGRKYCQHMTTEERVFVIKRIETILGA